MRISLPWTLSLLLITAARYYPKSPFPPDAAVTRAVEVEESQDMCPSYKQAHALWNHPDRQVTAKPLTNMSKQTDPGWSQTHVDRGLQLKV